MHYFPAFSSTIFFSIQRGKKQQSIFFRHFKNSQAPSKIYFWAIWKSVVTKSSISHISIERRSLVGAVSGRMSTFCTARGERPETSHLRNIFITGHIWGGSEVSQQIVPLLHCWHWHCVRCQWTDPGARCVSHASNASVLARCLTSVARWTGTRWHVPQSLSEQKTTCSLSSPWHLVPHPASQHQRSLNTHNLQS